MDNIIFFLEYIYNKKDIIDANFGHGITNIVIISILILAVILGIIYVLRKKFSSKHIAPSFHNSGISFGKNAKIGGNVIQKGKE